MWLKNVLLELGVSVVIVLATFFDLTWARWFVIIYTPFMVVLKLLALAGSGLLPSSQTDDQVPTWFWHANYAFNLIVLVLDRWWLMAAGWAVIWLLSVLTERRRRSAPRAKT